MVTPGGYPTFFSKIVSKTINFIRHKKFINDLYSLSELTASLLLYLLYKQGLRCDSKSTIFCYWCEFGGKLVPSPTVTWQPKSLHARCRNNELLSECLRGDFRVCKYEIRSRCPRVGLVIYSSH